MIEFDIIYPSGMVCVVGRKYIFDAIYEEVGDKTCDNGIPLAQEIEGWSELCHVGEEYHTDEFIVRCVER